MKLRPNSYTVVDAARELDISEDAVRKRIKRNTIENYRQDGRIYVVVSPVVEGEVDNDKQYKPYFSSKTKNVSSMDEKMLQRVEMYQSITDRNIELLEDQTKLLENSNKALMKSLKKLGDRYQEMKTERNEMIAAYKKLKKKCR